MILLPFVCSNSVGHVWCIESDSHSVIEMGQYRLQEYRCIMSKLSQYRKLLSIMKIFYWSIQRYINILIYWYLIFTVLIHTLDHYASQCIDISQYCPISTELFIKSGLLLLWALSMLWWILNNRFPMVLIYVVTNWPGSWLEWLYLVVHKSLVVVIIIKWRNRHVS